ncbi:GNAT family N-acetyltransferase [Flavobacterium sp. ZS1P14]|uniref:GNAT family N-acetyltransferase n=1 Tax=Flavobacterium sp. ZS1P14 TaxID=3401729 RepID=UPI003AAC7ABD
MIIEQINEIKKGCFRASDNAIEAGRITYTWAGTDKFIIDHTEVNDAFAGQSVGKKLVMEAVQFARENNLKILPLCPFAKSVFDKMEEIQDLLFKKNEKFKEIKKTIRSLASNGFFYMNFNLKL